MSALPESCEKCGKPWTSVSPAGSDSFGWPMREGFCLACGNTQSFRIDRPLPLYSGATVCPKCGHEEVSTRYCGLGFERLPHCNDPRPHLEHLHRTCQNCVYDWLEACLDAS